MAKQEAIQVVDEFGQIIGHKLREEVDPQVDRYMVSTLMMISPRSIRHQSSNVLVTERADTLAEDPGLRSPSVAGKLEGDDSFLTNIIKETEEELGVKNIQRNLEYVDTAKLDSPRRMFLAVYKALFYTGRLKLDKTEVKDAYWMPLEQLADDIEKDKQRDMPLYVPYMGVYPAHLRIWQEQSYFQPIRLSRRSRWHKHKLEDLDWMESTY